MFKKVMIAGVSASALVLSSAAWADGHGFKQSISGNARAQLNMTTVNQGASDDEDIKQSSTDTGGWANHLNWNMAYGDVKARIRFQGNGEWRYTVQSSKSMGAWSASGYAEWDQDLTGNEKDNDPRNQFVTTTHESGFGITLGRKQYMDLFRKGYFGDGMKDLDDFATGDGDSWINGEGRWEALRLSYATGGTSFAFLYSIENDTTENGDVITASKDIARTGVDLNYAGAGVDFSLQTFTETEMVQKIKSTDGNGDEKTTAGTGIGVSYDVGMFKPFLNNTSKKVTSKSGADGTETEETITNMNIGADVKVGKGKLTVAMTNRETKDVSKVSLMDLIYSVNLGGADFSFAYSSSATTDESGADAKTEPKKSRMAIQLNYGF